MFIASTLDVTVTESLEARITATKLRILPLLKIGIFHDCNPARTLTD